MAKQRKLRDQPFAERLERSFARLPAENLVRDVPSAPTLGRLVDPSGVLWLLRLPLTDLAARKLAATADVMIVGDGMSNAFVDQRDRAAMWASIEKHGCLPNEEPDDYLEYVPYEFDSEGGLVLLYLERHC